MKKNPLYKSFGYAFQGIFACIKKERNIKIHLTMMIYITKFLRFYRFRMQVQIFMVCKFKERFPKCLQK